MTTMPIKRIHTIAAVAASVLLLLLAGGCAGPGTGIVNEELVRSTRSWDGHLLPPYPRGQPEVSVRKIIIPPGTRLPEHLHPVINAGVLVRGEITVFKEGGEKRKVSAGEALIEVVDTWHYGVNTGRKPAEILVVYAGSEGIPTTVLKGH